MNIIKPISIPFSVYILDKAWKPKIITFPHTMPSGTEIHIFNIDKVANLLKKLYMITGIPETMLNIHGLTDSFEVWLKNNKSITGTGKIEDEEDIDQYRKLIFKQSDIPGDMYLGYITDRHEAKQWPKTIFRNRNVIIDNPLNALNSPFITFIRDIPSDNQYMQLKEIEHEVDDPFITDFAPSGNMVVVPLNAFISTTNGKLIASDPTSFERIYYGFIIKYYPALTELLFKSYLINSYTGYRNQTMQDELESIIAGENEIVLRMSKYKKDILSAFTIAITSTTFNIPGVNNKILLRNMFDKTHIASKTLNVFYMYMELTVDPLEVGLVDNKPIVIQLQKFKSNEYIPKITKAVKSKSALLFMLMFKNKLTKAMPQYLYLEENGDMQIVTTWPDASEMSIENIFAETYKGTSELISLINSNMAYYGNIPLKKITSDSIQVDMLSLSLTWSRDISLKEFRKIRELFREYIELEFAEYIGAVIFEIRWKYLLTDPCIIKFTYQITSIKIEISNVRLYDFNILLPFIYSYLEESYIIIKKQRNSDTTTDDADHQDTKRIRKLRNEDSILYDNLKPGIVYSKKCQGIRQPNILSTSEYQHLSAAERKKVTTYWNFRRNQPAYYTCQQGPNGDDLTFSYITGIHINDLCVPCCKSKVIDENSAKAERDSECSKKFKYIDKPYEPSTKSAYVIVSHKILNSTRIGYVPDDLIPIVGPDMYCRGVDQVINALPNSPANIIFSIIDALDMTLDNYIMGIIKNIKSQIYDNENDTTRISLRNPHRDNAYKSVTGGISSEYGTNLTNALIDIFINNAEFNNFQITNWVEFFVFQTLEVYNHNVVLFKVHSEELILLDNNSPKILIIEYTFPESTYAVTSNKLVYYPIYKMNPKKFYMSGEVVQKVFTDNFEQLTTLLSNETGITTKDFIELTKYKVQKLYVNRNNKCYGILISDGSSTAFIPVTYSNIYPNIPISYDSYNPKENLPSLTFIAQILNDIDVKPKSCMVHTPSKNVQFLNILGMNLYLWHPIEDVLAIWPNLPQRADDIDYIDVNIAIAQNISVKREYFDIARVARYRTRIYDLIKIELLNVIDTQHITLTNLRKLSLDEVAELIPHTVEPESKLDNNIIIPCAISDSARHCSKRKLIVPHNYKDFVALLKHEIDDPVIDFIETSKRNIVINILNFEQVNGEYITVKYNGMNISNLK